VIKKRVRGDKGVKEVKKNIFPILTIVLFILIIGVAVFRMIYQVRVSSDQIISREVVQLVEIFKRIDKKCKIIDFDYQKNIINFLNVEKFAGSEIGSMNLTYPKQWEGPYLNDNPTIQGKEYLIVRTKKGYFITPGQGVELANGKTIGKEILLDENVDISVLMADPEGLQFQGKALAAPLPIGMSSAQELLLENVMRAEDGLVLNEGQRRFHLSSR